MNPALPLEIRIENTNYCNAQCTICPREKMTREKGYMSFDLFKKITDEAAGLDIPTVHLHGFGEPLLDKSLPQKVRYAKEQNIKDTFIVTNASLLNESMITDLIQAGLDRIKVSFFGVNKQEYESIHLNLNYDTVRANIKKLNYLKKKLKKKNPKLSIKYIGKRIHFLQFILQWLPYGTVTTARLHNYGSGRNYRKVDYDNPRRTCKIIEERALQVYWDGRVVPCCYDFNGAMVLGNLNQESIKDIWWGKQYTTFRKLHQAKRFKELPFCYKCDKLQ